MKIEITAFHHWLIQQSERNKEKLAELIRYEVIYNQNKQAYNILEATGDKHYTPETFDKAAELLLNQMQ